MQRFWDSGIQDFDIHCSLFFEAGQAGKNQDARHKMQDTRHKMQDARCKMLKRQLGQFED